MSKGAGEPALRSIQHRKVTNQSNYYSDVPLQIIPRMKLRYKKNVFLVVSSSGYGAIFSKRFMNKLTEPYLPLPDILIIFRKIGY